MRHSKVFWGVILLTIGILFLLSNLGIITINMWGLIGPLVLIGLGVWVLWGVLANPSLEAEEITIPLEGARRGRIVVHHGAGRLRVSGGAAPDQLLTGSFGGGLDHRTDRHNGGEETLDVEMHVSHDMFFSPLAWMSGAGRLLDWTFELNEDIPLALDLQLGANEARLDLTQLQVTDLNLETGASSTELTMPASAGYTRATIESGAASLNLHFPPGVAARIEIESGLAGISVDQDRFPRSAGVYQSPDYPTAQNKADVRIDTGVGSVSIR